MCFGQEGPTVVAGRGICGQYAHSYPWTSPGTRLSVAAGPQKLSPFPSHPFSSSSASTYSVEEPPDGRSEVLRRKTAGWATPRDLVTSVSDVAKTELLRWKRCRQRRDSKDVNQMLEWFMIGKQRLGLLRQVSPVRSRPIRETPLRENDRGRDVPPNARSSQRGAFPLEFIATQYVEEHRVASAPGER